MADLDYTQGYKASGIKSLISEVNSIIMGDSGAGGHALSKLSVINKACDEYWDGEAKENFKKNLKADAELFKNRLKDLKDAFEAEVNNVGYAFQKFDENLIESDK